MLDSKQFELFREQGFLTIENLFSTSEIARLWQAAARIVDETVIGKNHSVFSTRDRDAGRDEYFFESAEQVHCFLEAGAVDCNGDLLRPKELAINKMGHAMHDLIPEF